MILKEEVILKKRTIYRVYIFDQKHSVDCNGVA